MALREVERARSPLWVSQAAAALVVLSMVLLLDGASSPHRLVILTTGAFVSPPVGSSRHWLVLFASRHRLFLLSTMVPPILARTTTADSTRPRARS